MRVTQMEHHRTQQIKWITDRYGFAVFGTGFVIGILSFLFLVFPQDNDYKENMLRQFHTLKPSLKRGKPQLIKTLCTPFNIIKPTEVFIVFVGNPLSRCRMTSELGKSCFVALKNM